MSHEFSFQSNVEILRMAEQQRGEAMASFFRWLVTKPSIDEAAPAADVVAAE